MSDVTDSVFVTEITPEDSVVPVFLDTTPDPDTVGEAPLDALLAEAEAHRLELEAAADDLVAQFGWTVTRARAVVGLPPLTE